MSDRQNQNGEYDLPQGLAQPARRALIGSGYTRLKQLAGVGEGEISRLHGIGPNALTVLHRALAERGLSFAISERAR